MGARWVAFDFDHAAGFRLFDTRRVQQSAEREKWTNKKHEHDVPIIRTRGAGLVDCRERKPVTL